LHLAGVGTRSLANVEQPTPRRSRHRDLPTALTGALAHFGLATLLTVLEMERRTGVLDLRGLEHSARISLREGQVVHAEIRGKPLRGADAVFELLGWVDGGFIFRIGEVSAANEVSLPTSMLLLEAARRADEMAA
jgi:hypothetical protein